MSEMTAVAWHGRGDVRVGPWPLADALPDGWVRLEVAWCGLCGSDVAEYASGPVVVPTRPHPLSGRQAPLVLGHEISGMVVATGTGVTGLAVGDAVVTDTLIGCETCAHCRRGDVNLCRLLAAAGLSADGGLADYVDVPAATCVPLPAHVPLDVAALAEPLAVAVRALDRAGPLDGADVVVLGAGTVGSLIALLLEATPARSLVVAERRAAQRGLVGRLTAAHVVESLGASPPRPDRRVVAFECTGSSAALNELIAGLPAHSRIVVVGVHGHRTPTDLHTLVHRELDLNGSLSHSRADFRRAVIALGDDPGRYEPLITHRIGWTDVPIGLHELAGAQTTAGKVLAGPEGDRWTT
ncbi:alcohol dehydrogenase catalytic domain-containing protein [Jiangella asiatica]|uniref:Alcohol dehydrogenase-like N-terminal domain-containing protein n=1 Tax=Jiangella asiatica TaxID=2530372 RepID=A0A4R5DLC1_9ACTN|nr:alcohol dehydrogenase catalytic domain-containing protein [Jiangella asiatica]TDE11433.1 hypothetical protein E1269_09185 [Jiangella asiatica]